MSSVTDPSVPITDSAPLDSSMPQTADEAPVTRQNPTEPDIESPIRPPSLTPDHPHSGLTPRQLTAIALLTSGKSVIAVASALGLHRSTIHTWKNDPAFAAELHRRQTDLARTCDARLIRLLYHATHTAIASLKVKDADDATRHAFRLITILRPWMHRLDQILDPPPTSRDDAQSQTPSRI
jgi:hypothetical protein